MAQDGLVEVYFVRIDQAVLHCFRAISLCHGDSCLSARTLARAGGKELGILKESPKFAKTQGVPVNRHANDDSYGVANSC